MHYLVDVFHSFLFKVKWELSESEGMTVYKETWVIRCGKLFHLNRTKQKITCLRITFRHLKQSQLAPSNLN